MRRSTFLSLAVSLVLAVVSVFAVRTFLADQQARLASGAKKPQGHVLVVAAEPMRFGDRLRSDNLKTIDWPAADTPAGSFLSIEAVLGENDDQPRYAMEAIDPGEPVLATKITGAGERATLSAALDKGMKAISIRVNDVLGVAGFVRPSDRVDVLLTRVLRSGADDSEQTRVDVLLQGVKVLAVDQTADERKDQPSVVKTVTFEVSTDEAQRLTLGANVGTLSLALRNIASSDVESTRPITIADLGGGPIAKELGKELAENGDNARLDELENMVRKVGTDLGARISSMENKADSAPAPAQTTPAVDVVPAPSPWGTVGVWNTTKREEHRVMVRPVN